MAYRHTQRGPLHWILVGVAVVGLVLATTVVEHPVPRAYVLIGVVLLGLFASCFARLTVREEGGTLVAAFGPLPVFQKRLPYEDVVSFRPTESLFMDGWGIHWIPGRGWTWNIWGKVCVEFETTRGLLRIGTDDVDGLVAHLEERLPGKRAGTSGAGD